MAESGLNIADERTGGFIYPAIITDVWPDATPCGSGTALVGSGTLQHTVLREPGFWGGRRGNAFRTPL